MKTTDFLKEIVDFQEGSTKRAHQKLMATGKHISHYNPRVNSYADKIEYEEDGIEFTFREDINHDCPDYFGVYLHLNELEMDEEQWDNYIESLKQKRNEEQRQKQYEKDLRLHKQKEEEYEKLKKELNK